ncbi:MAG: flagellar basal body-associated FliL family protein [bacterium]|nr:flagellar basal body-associated FliL family protein [bacterium]
MPDIKEKTEVAEQPAAAKKSLLPPNLAAMLTKVAMFGLIGVVAIFGAYMLTAKVLKPMMAKDTAVEQPAEPAKAEPVKEEKHEAAPPAHGGESSGHGEAGAAGSGNFFTVEGIVVNPAETQGTRYLSCSISFELASAEDKQAFEDKAVKIKDLLITILSSKTVDELADIKVRNDMRRQILVVVNRFTTPSQATAVYLTDFVLQ